MCILSLRKFHSCVSSIIKGKTMCVFWVKGGGGGHKCKNLDGDHPCLVVSPNFVYGKILRIGCMGLNF